MRKIFLFAFAFFLATATTAQNTIKKYVQSQTVSLTMEDTTGFAAIGNAIGEARIVLLGEQDHGDAAAFAMKTALVKYLHEQKGFNVLAFESDFFALNKGWEELPKTRRAIDSFLYHNPFPIWSWCHTTKELFYNYIPLTFDTKCPLQVSGFDLQLHGRYSLQQLGNYLKTMLSAEISQNRNNTTDEEMAIGRLSALTKFIMLSYDNPYNADSCQAFTDLAKPFLTLLINRHGFDDERVRILENAIAAAAGVQRGIKKDYVNYYKRDEQMARNLAWLFRVKYKGEKIIVWAHNAHIAKNAGEFYNVTSKQDRMMGSWLDRDPSLSGQLYLLGLTSFEGHSRWANGAPAQIPIPAPAKNSFERWINPAYRFAFTDFMAFREQNPGYAGKFFMQGSTMGNRLNQQANWTHIFDGVLFIREMYGCK